MRLFNGSWVKRGAQGCSTPRTPVEGLEDAHLGNDTFAVEGGRPEKRVPAETVNLFPALVDRSNDPVVASSFREMREVGVRGESTKHLVVGARVFR
jgi:hypothetical protein